MGSGEETEDKRGSTVGQLLLLCGNWSSALLGALGAVWGGSRDVGPLPPWLSLAEGCSLLGRGLPSWHSAGPAPWRDQAGNSKDTSLIQGEWMTRGWGGAAGWQAPGRGHFTSNSRLFSSSLSPSGSSQPQGVAYKALRQVSLTLSVQRSANIFCVTRDSRHFRLCWPHKVSLCCCHLKAARKTCKWTRWPCSKALFTKTNIGHIWPRGCSLLSWRGWVGSGSVGVMRMLLIIIISNYHPTKECLHMLRGLGRAYLNSDYTAHTV